MSRRQPTRGEPEHLEAVALIQWRDLMVATNPKLEPLRHLYHVSNGGKRTKAEAGKFKAEGVLAGVSDYCLPVPVVHVNGMRSPWEVIDPEMFDRACGYCTYGACYIELKPPGEYPKPHQYAFLRSMQEVGNFAAWGMGWEECAALLRWYLVRDIEQPSLRRI